MLDILLARVFDTVVGIAAASSTGQSDYAFYFSGNDSNFDFGVTRKEDRNEILFSTLGHRLIFKVVPFPVRQ